MARSRFTMSEKEAPIAAQVNLYDVSDKMFFAVHLGTADLEGEEMRLAVTAGGGALLFDFKGKQFMLDVSEIGLAIWEAMNGKPE